MKKLIVLSLSVITLVSFGSERIGSWWISVPASVIKSLGVSERTCAERAQQIFNDGSFKAAANEWKRFNNEFITTANEEGLAWASCMEAISLDYGKDRYKAIDLYSEVLELYPDSDAAGVALFFRGRAQKENGQLQKAEADFAELVANEVYNALPIAYCAHCNLAQFRLNQSKIKEAIAELQSVQEEKRDREREYWDHAGYCLSLLESFADPAGKIQTFLDKDESAEKKCAKLLDWRKSVWREVWDDRSAVVKSYFRSKNEKDPKAARMEYLKKFSVAFSKGVAPVFKEAGKEWDLTIIDLQVVHALMPKNLDKVITKAAAACRKIADQELRGECAIQLIDNLRNMNKTTEAKLQLDLISDPVKRAWAASSIGWSARDGKFVADAMTPIESVPDPEVADKAKRNHADACRELLNDFDTAIKLYEEAPKPPETLWKIARCHRAAGRKPKGQATLDEIVSMFPDEAASAMLTKGDWFGDDNDKKNAIGCYRRILAHKDWKKSWAASQAHQRLERYGIATGGAVLNDVY